MPSITDWKLGIKIQPKNNMPEKYNPKRTYQSLLIGKSKQAASSLSLCKLHSSDDPYNKPCNQQYIQVPVVAVAFIMYSSNRLYFIMKYIQVFVVVVAFIMYSSNRLYFIILLYDDLHIVL